MPVRMRFSFTRETISQETHKVLEFRNTTLSKRDKAKRNKAMSDVSYAQNLFREAFPEKRYGSVKNLLFEAQRFISKHVRKDFTHRRARSIWEGSARRIDAEEMDALRIAAIEESKREQREIRARLAVLDAKLAAIRAAEARSPVAAHRKRAR
ncbi:MULTISPECIES: hypothetical protein [Sinorhizobium]|uniref:hypothetical protein n=1 Tax=Sinorhizobium TaxID=28105 RepID=UPI000D4180EA|nr:MULTISPECIES: hypothetical protein [Sinorhizobium]POH32102.1 hypothetical protein ATY30_11930 [Sinorhizobium americanum]